MLEAILKNTVVWLGIFYNCSSSYSVHCICVEMTDNIIDINEALKKKKEEETTVTVELDDDSLPIILTLDQDNEEDDDDE